jgi:hypothetical protein
MDFQMSLLEVFFVVVEVDSNIVLHKQFEFIIAEGDF